MATVNQDYYGYHHHHHHAHHQAYQTSHHHHMSQPAATLHQNQTVIGGGCGGYPMSADQTTVISPTQQQQQQSQSLMEVTKSTKGASKQRRDQINAEIAQLRELLPLPASTRQRLSQLQLMALVLVYVRKSNYFGTGKSPPVHTKQSLTHSFTHSCRRNVLSLSLRVDRPP